MVNETGKKFFERTPAEFFDYTAHVFHRHIPPLAGARVEKLTPVHFVLHKLLRLQASEDGPNRGVRQRSVLADTGTYLFTRGRPVLPEKLHYLLLENTQAFLSWHESSVECDLM